MSNITVEPFNIIGIAVRTTNERGQASNDIPALWQKFLSENLIQVIPQKTDSTLYCVYTEYESDHQKPYTTILGCKVDSLSTIPEGMVGLAIKGGVYTKFTAKGAIPDGIVFAEWMKIWSANISRAFTADFEVYGAKASNPNDAEIDIFIALQA